MSDANAVKEKDFSTQDLEAIISSYNEVTARLKESHDTLKQEVRRLRDELASKNRQLERRKRLAALGEMAAGLAHELRNPLGGIRLYVDMLRGDFKDDPQHGEILDKIVDGIQSVDGLVADVLAMTHTVQPRWQECDLRQLINNSTGLIDDLAFSQNVEISLRTSGDLKLVCDRRMFQRALINLLRNAVEAAGEGGFVEVAANTDNSDIKLEIGDSGKGIDPHIAEKMFNPFFTTKDYGTGLGLAIVERIVESHGGSIEVGTSGVGGALFKLTLPVYGLSEVSKDRGLNDAIDSDN